MANVLGCEADNVQKSVFDLVSKIAALEIENDQLRKLLSHSGTLQDHSQCQKHIDELQAEVLNLEAALQRERETAASSSKTMNDLRDMIDSLRDQLSKHGVRQPLDYRLRQLGLQGDSGHLSASSDSNPSDY
ncbi:hypothetical protein AAVH_43459, partial [Aphelenchoides avenae]